MVSVKSLIGTAAAVMVSTTAFAADMPQPMPQLQYQPVVIQQPPTAWYLRGDVGVGMTNTFDIEYLPNPANVGNGFAFHENSIADSVFWSIGAGYEFNNWLRFDATVEYRDRTQVNARGFSGPINNIGGDTYQGYLKSWVFLANAYADLGTWWCLTPFVGFGVGGAYNQMADLVDQGFGTSNGGLGFGRNSTNWSPAYAAYAGVSFDVTQNFKMELTYRYLNYGSVTDTVDCINGCAPDQFKFKNLSSNDIMLGFRYRFPVESAPIIVTPQPVALQPAPVYAPPPPVYAPPPQYPLSTRG
jgi:opacity protein-like surface antigen